MSAYIYCRLSQDSKTGTNHSLDSQEELCKNYCETKKLPIKEVYRIVGSARNHDNHKELESLLSRMKEGDTLIIYDVSRFSRNMLKGMQLLQKIMDKKMFIHTIKENLNYDTIYNKLAFRQLLSYSEYESDQTSERIKTSINYRKNNGIALGPTKYGYESYMDNGIRKNRRSITEYNNIVKIRNMINDAIPINSIVTELNKTSTYRNKKWTHDNVLHIYKNDTYKQHDIVDTDNSKNIKKRKYCNDKNNSNKNKKSKF
jgi:DNA invertase Pin-like site-specific DNA recombinase